jgi:hypothetical protein
MRLRGILRHHETGGDQLHAKHRFNAERYPAARTPGAGLNVQVDHRFGGGNLHTGEIRTGLRDAPNSHEDDTGKSPEASAHRVTPYHSDASTYPLLKLIEQNSLPGKKLFSRQRKIAPERAIDLRKALNASRLGRPFH